MVDQDMQTALGVTSYQGRWALILDGVGIWAPHCPWRERLGELGPRQSCLTVPVGEMDKNSVLERLKLHVYGESVLFLTSIFAKYSILQWTYDYNEK